MTGSTVQVFSHSLHPPLLKNQIPFFLRSFPVSVLFLRRIQNVERLSPWSILASKLCETSLSLLFHQLKYPYVVRYLLCCLQSYDSWESLCKDVLNVKSAANVVYSWLWPNVQSFPFLPCGWFRWFLLWHGWCLRCFLESYHLIVGAFVSRFRTQT